MVTKKTWQEFRDAGMLWWINSILHIFGWSIVVELAEETNEIAEVYPVRTKFRGFSEDIATEGFKKVTNYMSKEIENLKKEVGED